MAKTKSTTPTPWTATCQPAVADLPTQSALTLRAVGPVRREVGEQAYALGRHQFMGTVRAALDTSPEFARYSRTRQELTEARARLEQARNDEHALRRERAGIEADPPPHGLAGALLDCDQRIAEAAHVRAAAEKAVEVLAGPMDAARKAARATLEQAVGRILTDQAAGLAAQRDAVLARIADRCGDDFQELAALAHALWELGERPVRRGEALRLLEDDGE